MWQHGGYNEKQRLQYYLFPKGICYNRKTDSVRTEKYNSLFLWIARKQQEVGETKNGIPELNLSYAALVAYGLNLSNFIYDFQSIRNLINSANSIIRI